MPPLDPATPAMFTVSEADPDVLHPLPWATSQWGDGRGRVRGMAVSGALARACERFVAEVGPAGARPVRWSVDLFRVAEMAPCVTTTTVVRQGKRLCLVDAQLRQDDEVRARAKGLFLVPPGAGTPGDVWTPEPAIAAPPSNLRPWAREPRLYFSEGAGWTASPEPHQNAWRKAIWQFPVDVVADERSTPFQTAAVAADLASVVTNWGDEGLAFINADLDLLLGRLPEDREVGLAALHHVEEDGLAAGTTVVFDRTGSVGTASVTALARGQIVDPRARAR